VRDPFEDFWRIAERSNEPLLWWPLVILGVGVVICGILLVALLWGIIGYEFVKAF
jgi:Tfp pilus assembly protein PilN